VTPKATLDVGGDIAYSGQLTRESDQGKKSHVMLSSGDASRVTHTGILRLVHEDQVMVTLPSGSDLDADFHTYQLTAVGKAMPNLYVSEEVHSVPTSDGQPQRRQFGITGGVPGGKVSWAVTSGA